MKMKKLLSIGALALTITTCTSMSAFAAESAGTISRNQAVKEIAMNAYTGGQVVNNLNITVKTPVKSYAKQPLVDGIKYYVTKGLEGREEIAAELNKAIQSDYQKGLGLKTIFDRVVDKYDITTDSSFAAAEAFVTGMLNDFEDAYDNNELDQVIDEYFDVDALNGTLTYGKNYNNRLVVTLEKNGQVILQVSSENVYALEKEIRENVHSWSDLNSYFNKIK